MGEVHLAKTAGSIARGRLRSAAAARAPGFSERFQAKQGCLQPESPHCALSRRGDQTVASISDGMGKAKRRPTPLTSGRGV